MNRITSQPFSVRYETIVSRQPSISSAVLFFPPYFPDTISFVPKATITVSYSDTLESQLSFAEASLALDQPRPQLNRETSLPRLFDIFAAQNSYFINSV